jgi:uncharacterized lipoprotein YmbA
MTGLLRQLRLMDAAADPCRSADDRTQQIQEEIWALPLDKWIIEYMTDQKMAVPDGAVVVSQSAGGWAQSRFPARISVSLQRMHAARGGAR